MAILTDGGVLDHPIRIKMENVAETAAPAAIAAKAVTAVDMAADDDDDDIFCFMAAPSFLQSWSFTGFVELPIIIESPWAAALHHAVPLDGVPWCVAKG